MNIGEALLNQAEKSRFDFARKSRYGSADIYLQVYSATARKAF